MVFAYILWNINCFLLVKIDKRRASRKQWRISERTFFGVAALFGAAGVLAGMYVFRHKTQHISFVLGIPMLLVSNLICVYLLGGYK